MKKLVPLFVVLALFGCKKQGVDESLNDKLVKSAAMGRIDEVKQYLPSYFHKGGDVRGNYTDFICFPKTCLEGIILEMGEFEIEIHFHYFMGGNVFFIILDKGRLLSARSSGV